MGFLSLASRAFLRHTGRMSVCAVRCAHQDALVSTEWLANNLGQRGVKVLHSSWSNCEDYAGLHIPTSLCFNGSECLDKDSPYLNMMPPPQVFQSYMHGLGVSNTDLVIVYDSLDSPNIPSATRLWWTFHVFGHPNVAVLDGGMKKWVLEDRKIEIKCPDIVPGSDFLSNYDRKKIASYEEIKENVISNKRQVIDARPEESFYAIDENGNETHIPNSIHFDAKELINVKDTKFKTRDEIQEIFSILKIKKHEDIISTCRTGMLATSLLFASNLIGVEIDQLKLYDGSWYEYNEKVKQETEEK